MNEEIKIFFCFSDETESDERMLKLKLFEKSQQFHEIFNLHLDDWRGCGLMDATRYKKKCQEIFDEQILKSDFVVFLFKDKIKRYMLHEWKLCTQNQSNKPSILLGIKYDYNNKSSADRMRRKLGYGDSIIDKAYNCIDEMELAILLKLLQVYIGGIKDLENSDIEYYNKHKDIITSKISLCDSFYNKLCKESDEMRKEIKEQNIKLKKKEHYIHRSRLRKLSRVQGQRNVILKRFIASGNKAKIISCKGIL